MLIADGIAEIILIGKPEQIMAKAQELSLNNIDKATIVDNTDTAVTEKYAELFYELRKKQGNLNG